MVVQELLWLLSGMIQDQYESDDAYKMKLQGMVIKSFEGKHFTIEAEGAAKN